MNPLFIFHQTKEPTASASLVSANAVSRYRVRAVFDVDPAIAPGTLDLSSYEIARQDGGPVDIVILSIAIVGGVALDLNLDDALIPEIVYLLNWSTFSVPFSFQESLFVPQTDQEISDPEAEVFGRDVAWLQGQIGADGDIPSRKGIACLKNDLFGVGFLRQGDLAQYPDRGADIQSTVNGIADESSLQATATALDREWLLDDRVVESNALPQFDSEGNAIIKGNVKTLSLQESIKVG